MGKPTHEFETRFDRHGEVVVGLRRDDGPDGPVVVRGPVCAVCGCLDDTEHREGR